MAASRTVFIAGAGIGGLTASLALAAKGFRVVILEKAERLEEVGAGLQLSPNASRVLCDFGMAPQFGTTQLRAQRRDPGTGVGRIGAPELPSRRHQNIRHV